MTQAQNSKSNPPADLGHVDNVSVPLTSYTAGSTPRQGKSDAVEGPPPGHRQQVLARTSLSTDRAGASLRIQSVLAGDRARTIASYLRGQPAGHHDPLKDRQAVGIVQPYAGGVSPLWRRRQVQQDR
jgi:hypothetical protein